MTHKQNVVWYPDPELVEKPREFGFNLSKTFENHQKGLVSHVGYVYGQNKSDGW